MVQKNRVQTQAKDNVARRIAIGSACGTFISLGLSSCQAWTGWMQLQEARAAAIKIESDKPSGTLGVPWVLMKVHNVTEKPIHDAQVGGALVLLPPDKVGEVFNLMQIRTEDIPPTGFEPQRLHVSAPLSDQIIARWRSGDLVLVGAVRVKWKNAGAWTHSTADRCFAWVGEPTREIACEDLMQMSPQQAQEHVQQVLAMQMKGRPEASAPDAAFEPGNN